MKSVLLRSGSVPVLSGSPRSSLSGHDSVAGSVFSPEKSNVVAPKISLHLTVNGRRKDVSGRFIRRAMSESDMVRVEKDASGGFSALIGAGSRSFPGRIPEEDYLSEVDEGGDDLSNYAGIWPESGIPLEELGFSGSGMGKGNISGGGGGGDDVSTGGDEGRKKIGAYYQEMLKSNPEDSLLLRNYGKFLHEVEKDMIRAEEYYGRAILASPGDGEVLSLYAKLIWETQRDESRAKSYFDQAVNASPDDCMVLGSYAHFMWEADEDEDEDEEKMKKEEADIRPLLAAF